MSGSSATIDTVTLNIIHNALTNIASEMALVMLTASYSTISSAGLELGLPKSAHLYSVAGSLSKVRIDR